MEIGVVLSGCGVMDGAEIHEAVLTLLSVAKHGAKAVCMAPNLEQAHVINHLTNEEMPEKRNVLVEAARIARGDIQDIQNVRADDVDALIFPGGYGAAKNLCTFAFDGPDCRVHPEVVRLAREVHEQHKPLGAICIAPALIAKIFQGESFQLTIGNDKETAGVLEAMGHSHKECGVTQVSVDRRQKIVTTPAYMLARNPAEAFEGIDRLVSEVLKLIGQPASRV